ncbi:MAG: ABC transporter ATP-binding protein [Ginsengibacter sp.]
MIKVDRVVKYFGKAKAVDDISFEVEEMENVALLGTSGCGKTTTLRMINRLIEISSGSISIAGKNIIDVPQENLRRNIGYVLQHNGLFPHYTVAENIAIVPNLLQWPKNKIANRVLELSDQLNLPREYLSLYPNQLSGGQQQRVGLARGLAADPPVLLMDEPFGALDAVTRSNITKEFSRLEVLKKKTIVLVTHDIREAFDMGDKILLMDKGKIIQAGTPTDLLFKPVNKFVSDFFEGQRMQLELHSVSLKELWPYLSIDKSAHKDLPEIAEDKTLWDALDTLSNHRNTDIAIRSILSGEVRHAGYNSLFNALGTMKEMR